MSDVQEVKTGIRLSNESGLVEYGAIVEGVFHPFFAERTGDYQERQSAGEQEQADAKASSGKSK